ncbi:MAG: hypothetical protein WEG56_11325 [Chloroflexota bacterium]
MPTYTRHLRSVAIAASAIALTAGIALASPPASVNGPNDAAHPGLGRAEDAAGMVVPVLIEIEVPGAPELPVREPDDPADLQRPQNHGWHVSEAAVGDTPDGFDDHGAYVSSIAKSDLGMPDAAAEAADRAEAGRAKAAEGTAAGLTKAAAAKTAAPAAPAGRP